MTSSDPTLADLVFPRRDETFVRVVARLSEPTNAPAGDNLVSNEDSYPHAADALGRRVPDGGVYIGVGPDQNLTLIGQARPDLAFIVDYRRRNLLVHLLHKALFQLAPTRVDYLSRLTARDPGRLPDEFSPDDLVSTFRRAPYDPARAAIHREEVARILRPLGVLDESEWADLTRIQSRLAGPGLDVRFLALKMYPPLSWLISRRGKSGRPAHVLGDDSSYAHVRTLHQNDRILPVVGDFAGTRSLKSLGEWLRKRRLEVRAFYASDVEFFLLRAGKFGAYLANLEGLPWSENAVIVRTSTREIEHPERIPGQSSTTILVNTARFLGDARAGKIRTVDDLFKPS